MAEPNSPQMEDQIALEALAGILNSAPGYKVLLKQLKNDVLRKWVDEKNPDGREALWHAIHAIGALENKIKATLDNVRMAKAKTEKVERRRGA